MLAEFGFNAGRRIGSHPRMLADITGDGKADVVAFGDAAVYTAIATGDGGVAAFLPMTVPNLIGNTAEQAIAALTAAGFSVGTRSTLFDRSCRFIGLVMGQTPLAGTMVPRGSAVNFTVGRNPLCPGCTLGSAVDPASHR